MTTLLEIAIIMTPFAAVLGLLKLADRISHRREAVWARQIQLTDAIHRELGAAAAPLVRRRPGGAWLVAMAVPFDRPGTVAALLRITHRVFASTGGVGDKSLEIVLTPNAPALDAHAGPARPAGNRSAAPLVPALR